MNETNRPSTRFGGIPQLFRDNPMLLTLSMIMFTNMLGFGMIALPVKLRADVSYHIGAESTGRSLTLYCRYDGRNIGKRAPGLIRPRGCSLTSTSNSANHVQQNR
jgi:hypothetical protein